MSINARRLGGGLVAALALTVTAATPGSTNTRSTATDFSSTTAVAVTEHTRTPTTTNDTTDQTTDQTAPTPTGTVVTQQHASVTDSTGIAQTDTTWTTDATRDDDATGTAVATPVTTTDDTDVGLTVSRFTTPTRINTLVTNSTISTQPGPSGDITFHQSG